MSDRRLLSVFLINLDWRLSMFICLDFWIRSERREVPPPKRESRVRVDRSISLRETKQAADSVDGAEKSDKKGVQRHHGFHFFFAQNLKFFWKRGNRRIQRRRSNSVDSSHSNELRRVELRKKEEKRHLSRQPRREIPDWPIEPKVKYCYNSIIDLLQSRRATIVENWGHSL